MNKIITKNKKALFDYKIEDTLKAGVVLSGAEVKAVKGGQVNLRDSFANMSAKGELWLTNCHISAYKGASNKDYEPTRSRKLLVTKKELNVLRGKLKEKGLTLIPLEVFLEKNFIKVKLGLGRGKKMYEKRETIKKREAEREIRKHQNN